MLFINPKTTKPTEQDTHFFREPNSGLLYLAAILHEYDFEVELLDLEQYLHVSKAAVKSALIDYSSSHHIIGITSLTNNFQKAMDYARIIRRKSPKKIIIFGGAHVSFLSKQILKRDYEKDKIIDLIVVGEAEISLPKLMQLIKSNNITHQDLMNIEQKIRKIPNLAYINSRGKYEYTGNQSEIIDLNTLPLPARYKLRPVNFYYTVANIIINRGCPNQCSFCSRQQLFKSTRLRSLQSIDAEIRDIKSMQTYEFINFYDNINLNLTFFEKLCTLLQNTYLQIPWGCELRVDNLSPKHVRLLQKSGCQVIATGIESASKEVLRKNFKYQDPHKVKKGLEHLKKYDIPVQAYFVLGLPGETEQTFRKTLDYIKQLPLTEEDTINYFVATPYPGSRLWTEREEFGINIIEHDFTKYDCEHIIFETKDLSYSQLKEMLQEAKDIETSFMD
ncbi:MAG: Ribosomal protein S12 methylthiotransferase RimO [Promethearchaeota archaeon]|nr:MAG: Ribosomal protein S12 methylthiotransferase RimO [Candidatus Lokiarchaeota archaeon]